MRIAVKKTKRKSIAYSLAPEELTILIPDSITIEPKLEKVLSANNGFINNKETITADVFHEMLNDWIEKLEVKPEKVQLKKMKSKWASFSTKKNLAFNTYLTSMPKEFVSYVICHELLHFKVPKHNKLFKNLLSVYMPDWQERISKAIEYVLAQNNWTSAG